MDFRRLKVSSRLMLGFGSVLLLLLIIISMALLKMDQIDQQLSSITDVNNAEVQQLSIMRAAVFEQSLASRGILMSTTSEELKQYADLLPQQISIYSEAEKTLAKMFAEAPDTTDTEKKAIILIQQQSAEVLPRLQQLIKAVRDNDSDAIKAVLAASPLSRLQAQRRATLAELARFEDKLNGEARDDAKALYKTARRLIVTLGVLALLLGMVSAILIIRSVVKQLGGEPADAAELASLIAKGDLRREVNVASADPASLMMSMKSMNTALRDIVREVRAGTDAITTASTEIAAGNLDLSSRTEEQASSLEQTASAMEQLVATVKNNADSAGQANQLAEQASAVASESGQLVQEVVSTMAAIDASSKKIVDIISVIDGISFQTNILALNAAVEAARAGEQGRGFAVVASEVRSLAQRSSTAAREIKALIDDSVDKVATGSALVNQAGQTMHEVVTSVERVVSVIGAISAASSEQSKGIDEINHAIAQMDQVTQQNAALVEQAAAASQSLQAQARKLSGVVEVFVVA
ncbi:methyl-accepting chemotaxis protein [Herbaspirillum rubrisubalbicans]|uniref:Chemotaxis protein n=1 Tax=Herbaspirillum rubrisubalbicans TaxID=80842 RepID=A0AAD0XHT6_9BURK|nr:methyl-accepting chemotaxis protein [Herbaspirillum rubrisubalbicans]ALU90797.1 Methyl-accepting chemotaxis sensory transducer protein I [Herbaspirillum rubrisubalbicans M1]AYR25852.1 chemotaxis protein [Herbaspirillum rubrisubalbicans]